MAVACFLYHLFYKQSHSCKFWEDCFVLECYKEYKGEKIISIVPFFLRVLGYFGGGDH